MNEKKYKNPCGYNRQEMEEWLDYIEKNLRVSLDEMHNAIRSQATLRDVVRRYFSE